eukprot:12371021-Ditylum_brightwellii.AAC.1
MSRFPVDVCAVGEHKEAKDTGPFSLHICKIHINPVLLEMADHAVVILNLVERRLGSNQPLRDKTSFILFVGAILFKVFPFEREICSSGHALGMVIISGGPFFESKRRKTPGQKR